MAAAISTATGSAVTDHVEPDNVIYGTPPVATARQALAALGRPQRYPQYIKRIIGLVSR